MFRRLVPIAFAIAAVGTRAFAEGNGDSQVRLQGTAKAVCGMTAAQSLGGSNMRLAQSGQRVNSVTIPQLTDPVTAQLQTAGISLRFKALCNGPHFVSLSTAGGGLVPDRTVTVLNGDFARRVNYRAVLTWNGQSADFTTNGIENEQTPSQFIPGAFAGDLLVDVSIGAGTNNLAQPVVAGIYSDMLILKLGPRF